MVSTILWLPGPWKNPPVPFLAFSAVLTGAVAVGWCFGRWIAGPGETRAFRAALYLSTGLVLIHAVLAWLDLVGLRWRVTVVAGIVLAMAVLVRRLAAGRRRDHDAGPDRAGSLRLGWAGLAAAAVVAFFAVLAASERIAFPDFVYHWGIKGHRYFLLGGIDYDFLGQDWNLVAHRDYPQLVPELYALQSLIAGRFSEPALLLWSAVWFAALLIAAREALDAWSVRRDWARWVFAILTLAIGVFAVGHLMAGSVDWIIAFALTAALPALVRPVCARGELQLGALAALAASAKLEGIPLAGLLIVAGLWRRASLGGGSRLRSLGGTVLRLATPAAIAAAPWLIQGLRHDLFRDPQSSALQLDRAPAIAVSLWQAMLRPEWHLAPLVLFLLPLLLLRRDTRLVGAVVTLLLAGYVLRYFTASFDYQFSVLSSFPRLVFHVFPAVVVGVAAVAVPPPPQPGMGQPRAR
jgi:hypothetical protein